MLRGNASHKATTTFKPNLRLTEQKTTPSTYSMSPTSTLYSVSESTRASLEMSECCTFPLLS